MRAFVILRLSNIFLEFWVTLAYCLRISKPFLGDKNSIYDDDMVAKIEFCELRKDARPKTDFTGEAIRKLWVDTSI